MMETSNAKIQREINQCIQCALEPARFQEKDNALNKFCGSSCQWFFYHCKDRVPDIRGMTPQQVIEKFLDK